MVFPVKKILVYVALFCSWGSTQAWAQLARIKKPKLIVTLVVDQLRSDQLFRFQNRFLPALGAQGEPGGFRYLMERAAYYPQAEFGLLHNMTCPGHATVLSGAHAYQHGIPINSWYDPQIHKSMYCVEDAASPLVGVSHPASKRGISPKNFRGSTLGDELKSSGYPSRVVSIALKDRSAVLLGGPRADLALWFDSESQNWISSRYYLPDGKLPSWVQTLNENLRANRSPTVTWNTAEGSGSGTSWTNNQHILPSKTVDAIGRDFPHQISPQNPQALYLTDGTVWTTSAAIQALDSLKLGRGTEPDLLAVSFSSHDSISHTYGPNSRELEEMTLIEDREIARLLTAIKKSVGFEHSIIVLTGDHGGMPSPEWLRAEKVEAGRVDQDALLKQGEAFLSKTYGTLKNGSWLPLVSNFNYYLNPEALKQYKLERDEVLNRLRRFYQEEARGTEGILHLVTATDIRLKSLPPGLFQKQILQTYSLGRSGDLIMILKPHYVMSGSTGEHVSGYTYDRMVPLLIAGPQIKAGVYGQKAEIIDIAPTLAFFAGTTPPTGSEGRVLHEILRQEQP